MLSHEIFCVLECDFHAWTNDLKYSARYWSITLDLRSQFSPCQRHIGPHVHASLLCRLLLALRLLMPCQLTSSLEIQCQSSSISAFRLFFWCMSPFAIVWLALVSCRLPCPTHVPAISIFFPWWWGPFFVVSSDFVKELTYNKRKIINWIKSGSQDNSALMINDRTQTKFNRAEMGDRIIIIVNVSWNSYCRQVYLIDGSFKCC